MNLAVEVLNLAAAGGCLLAGLRRAGGYLGVVLASDVLREGFSHLREGYPKPYQGMGFWLWAPDPIAMFLIPATLLYAVGVGWLSVLPGILCTLVLVLYPLVRGAALISVYQAVYLAVYLLVGALVFGRSTTRKISPEEALLLLYALTGVAGVVLTVRFGPGEWWSARVPNGAAYLASLLVAGHEIQRRGWTARPP